MNVRTSASRTRLSVCAVSGALLIAQIALGTARAQEPPLDRLEHSPRHQEWVQVKNGDRTVHCFVVYPEVKERTPAVLVIHENMGLTDWVRGVADQLAEAGYIAIAPDLLSGSGPNGGRTKDFPNTQAAREAIYALPPDQVTADLNAVGDYVIKVPAANGKVAVAGFCWGGSQSFRFATNRRDLAAAFVFYGSAPTDADALGRITCPVYGFYGERDARVGATIPDTGETMKKLSKTYEPVSYEGGGHGFMRTGEDGSASPADREARAQAWQRWKATMKSAFEE